MRRLGDALLLGALVAILAVAAVVVLHHPTGGSTFIDPVSVGITAASPTGAPSTDPSTEPSAGTSAASTGGASPTASASDRGPVTVMATGDQITSGDGSWYALTLKADSKLNSLGNVASADTTSRDLQAGFGRDVLAKHPQLVLIMGGSADAAQKVSLPTTIANLRMMIKAAQDAGTKVALCTVPPRNAVPVYPLNAELRTLATETGALLLELHDPVSTAAGVWVPADTSDGVIPNATGAQVMAAAAAGQLAKAGL